MNLLLVNRKRNQETVKMDKKNLFNKGINGSQCPIFNFYRKHNVSFEKYKSMTCINKKGHCNKPLIRINCRITVKTIKQMVKDNKSFIDVDKYIRENVF